MSKPKATLSEESVKDNLKIDIKKLNINVSQEVIVTTEDKIVLCLHEYLENIDKRRSWIAPFGILLTILMTLATTTFRSIFFPAETWQAIFVIAAVLSGVWLAVSLYQSPKAMSVQDIVKKLKVSK